MIFVKHGKVIVVLSNISMINMIHISFMVLSFYGLWSWYSPSILRNSMGYIQTDKNQLSVMYAFEYLIESALNRV
ncbi:Uncharacterised protein [Klebsiella pneumoniae]|nr:Uncharacterised protein [Klebsiella pneumoniae]